MDQDLALVVYQEGIPHAAEVQRVDDLRQAVQCQVTTDHSHRIGHLVEDADHHLVGGHVDVGFGQQGAAGTHAILVPGACAGIVPVRHLCIRAHAEAAIDPAQVNGKETRYQRLLAHQGFSIGRLLGDILRQVLDQFDTSLEQTADVGRRRGAHLSQVVLKVLANRITLQVVVVEGEQAECEDHDQ